MMKNVLIYGSYGYTGELIVNECISRGFVPILGGRNSEKLRLQATDRNLEYFAFDLKDTEALHQFLSKGEVVIHCAGPFIHTAQPMLEACIATKTHYLDITGEYQVFDLAQTYSEQAKQQEIMVMPGAGFDVVPSDCLAAHLHDLLPDAEELILAFVNKGGSLSRGTTKTMIENIGAPQMYRKNGQYVGVPMGSMTRLVDYGELQQVSMGISWGDISTAYFSTGIPTIKVFAGTHPAQIKKVNQMRWLSPLLKLRPVKNFLKKQIDKKPAGPSEEKREKSVTYLWGQVRRGEQIIEARLRTPNGYTLTFESAVRIASKVLGGDFKAGYQTPSTAYGKGLILEMSDCHLM